MKLSYFDELSGDHRIAVFHLWNKEYPSNLAFKTMKEMDKFMEGLKDKHHGVVESDEGKVMAWMGIFTRQKERWFSILVNRAYQGRGVGKLLLDEAKKREDSLNGWVLDHNRDKKLDGDPYYSPLGFYLKNGFDVYPDTRYEHNGISAVKINWTQE